MCTIKGSLKLLLNLFSQPCHIKQMNVKKTCCFEYNDLEVVAFVYKYTHLGTTYGQHFDWTEMTGTSHAFRIFNIVGLLKNIECNSWAIEESTCWNECVNESTCSSINSLHLGKVLLAIDYAKYQKNKKLWRVLYM